MKNFYFITFLLSPLLASADNNKPPPGYWSYDGQAISFCFQFNQEDICSKLPMDELRKIILESDGIEENLVSSLHIESIRSNKNKSIVLKH